MEHIQFGEVDLEVVKAFFAPEKPDFFLICDTQVAQFCLSKFLNGADIPYLIIESGEENKTLESCQEIWDFAQRNHFSRDAICINLGGGLVSDMGGFAASIYKRGIRFVNVPTSLLAMVDASVGAKTGVNYHYTKNLLGTFSEPERIFIDNSWLTTLPTKELLSGKAEMLKHSLLVKPGSFDNWANTKIPDIAEIKECIQCKWSIVSQDPLEKGIRKALNLGHTAGHAIESILTIQGNSLPHGHCVAAGIIIEMWVSELLGLAPNGDFDEYTKKIFELFGRIDVSKFNRDEWIEFMMGDKKNEGQSIKPALISSPGNIELNRIVDQEIWLKAFERYANESQN